MNHPPRRMASAERSLQDDSEGGGQCQTAQGWGTWGADGLCLVMTQELGTDLVPSTGIEEQRNHV